MHKNKLVPPTSTYGQGNHAPTVEEATDVFIAWLSIATHTGNGQHPR